MPTLPDGMRLDTSIVAQRQPSRTWRLNKETNRIEGEIDGIEAVRQAVEIILNTERFRWAIFQPYTGVEWNTLIGQDPGYVGANLLRCVREALTVDDRIRGVSNYKFSIDRETLTAEITVNTVYGDFQVPVEVNVN